MAKIEIPKSISPSAPQMDRLGRIKAGCRKEYGDRYWTAEEILTDTNYRRNNGGSELRR